MDLWRDLSAIVWAYGRRKSALREICSREFVSILGPFFVLFAPFRGYSGFPLFSARLYLRKSVFICGSSVFPSRTFVSIRGPIFVLFAPFRGYSGFPLFNARLYLRKSAVRPPFLRVHSCPFAVSIRGPFHACNSAVSPLSPASP
jgi:hypothetical protein